MRKFLIIFLLPLAVFAKTDYSKYTTAGNIYLTVTNFGVLGTGFRIWDPVTGERQPSCEYPVGTKTEHLCRTGPWVGAMSPQGICVTTGVNDATTITPGSSEGFEFYPTRDQNDVVIEKSSLMTSSYYSLDAVSEQDFYATYYDTSYVVNHTPLGLEVSQVSYVWSYSYIDDVVTVRFVIKNIGDADLENVYIGTYGELVSANRDFWGDDFNRTPCFQHKRLFYEDSLHLVCEKNDGYDYLAEGVFGIGLVGVERDTVRMDLDSLTISFNWWSWRDMQGTVKDSIRYSIMSNGQRDPDMDDGYVMENGYPDPMPLLSAGPIPYLNRGDSLTVTFALCGGMTENELYHNFGWAKRAYEANYVLPAPPPSPRLVAIPDSRRVILYFDNSPEFVRDPSPPNLRDFEGYRIYRSETGLVDPDEWILLYQFDKTPEDTVQDVDHSQGFNTGMPGKETDGEYEGWYKIVDSDVRNGFTYYYAVTSYDVGNPDIGVPPLESSLRQDMVEVIPGTPPTSEPDEEVGVYPNPYRVSSMWDTGSPRGRVLRFCNLPERASIYIYNLAGDLVKTIEHEGTVANEPGGEAVWDLITDREQAVATGLYIFCVKDHKTGRIKKGKFLVIK
ncbi:hypothetical protein CH333_05290 [candidate division WOR-3 bacterium JGI_Cruoil_03_44_89]|uniref:Secretion system C-terminal sorting domain-containing protein n=1 Tax=candidate division WOR-3 bacterium JGI_Cruoil_03_44_89 TaxID=1973748 RepID=A0A235BU63_UNCW3|nr:MAG: hypothetical protein CH333_05290 [candidate division WOR-3 bacterium JGI_Cruoil_03_44_89]